MTDKIQTGFETFARSHGLDLSSAGGHYNRPVVRRMWAAWQRQDETVTDIHAALSRSTERNAYLANQCRYHDTRHAVADALAMICRDKCDPMTVHTALMAIAEYVDAVPTDMTGMNSYDN